MLCIANYEEQSIHMDLTQNTTDLTLVQHNRSNATYYAVGAWNKKRGYPTGKYYSKLKGCSTPNKHAESYRNDVYWLYYWYLRESVTDKIRESRTGEGTRDRHNTNTWGRKILTDFPAYKMLPLYYLTIPKILFNNPCKAISCLIQSPILVIVSSSCF